MPKLDTYVKGIITSSETSRRLACDASVVHWLDTQKGELLSIGRKSRTIPPAIRRALQRRDGRCRFPGCTCSRFVDAHHVHHWADGGEFTFAMPDGRALSNNRHGRFRGNVNELKARNHDNDIEISPFTAIPKLDHGHMDHQMGLDVLIQRE